MTRFVLIVPFAPLQTQQAILDLAKRSGWAWWHWGAETWLISTPDPQMSAESMRDKVLIVVPRIQFLVTRVEVPQTGVNWGCYGPFEWGEWMRESWEG
jgi:hypothetical protein